MHCIQIGAAVRTDKSRLSGLIRGEQTLNRNTISTDLRYQSWRKYLTGNAFIGLANIR